MLLLHYIIIDLLVLVWGMFSRQWTINAVRNTVLCVLKNVQYCMSIWVGRLREKVHMEFMYKEGLLYISQ